MNILGYFNMGKTSNKCFKERHIFFNVRSAELFGLIKLLVSRLDYLSMQSCYFLLSFLYPG